MAPIHDELRASVRMRPRDRVGPRFIRVSRGRLALCGVPAPPRSVDVAVHDVWEDVPCSCKRRGLCPSYSASAPRDVRTLTKPSRCTWAFLRCSTDGTIHERAKTSSPCNSSKVARTSTSSAALVRRAATNPRSSSPTSTRGDRGGVAIEQASTRCAAAFHLHGAPAA
jgi:hypothetical protein